MMAKFADTIGRAETYCVVCVFYMVGYILLGSSKTIGQIAGGTIVYTSVSSLACASSDLHSARLQLTKALCLRVSGSDTLDSIF